VLQLTLKNHQSYLGVCVLQCVAVCCSVLQCVAVCCNVLRCVAADFREFLPVLLQRVRVAVYCSGLQWVAVGCSVLQCVATDFHEFLFKADFEKFCSRAALWSAREYDILKSQLATQFAM